MKTNNFSLADLNKYVNSIWYYVTKKKKTFRKFASLADNRPLFSRFMVLFKLGDDIRCCHLIIAKRILLENIYQTKHDIRNIFLCMYMDNCLQ